MHILDADSLINLQRFFPRDVMPLVWETIETSFQNGSKIVSHREVYRELMQGGGDDTIKKWASENPGFFIEVSATQGKCISEIELKFPALSPRLAEPDPFADPWLVAIALATIRDGGEATVVSEEKLKGKGSCKVPNLCGEFGIPCTNLVGMFRQLGLRWK